ncbi:Kinesin-4 [Dactylellina cionopaga]|nr:Kinesin-4 [Dactylellina cionopaga]
MATQTTTLPRPGAARSALPRSPAPSTSLPHPPSSSNFRKSSASISSIKSLKRPSSYASLREESDKINPSRLSTQSERNVAGSARIFSLPPNSPLAPGGSGVAGNRRASSLAPVSPITPATRKSSLNPKGRFPLNVTNLKKKEEGLGVTLSSEDTVPPPSPPLSRSSSQLGNYLETPMIDSGSGSRCASAMGDDDKDKSKGNVLVSMRVRPAGETAKESSEWTIESSKSLVRYNGKEGGDYYLDNVFSPRDSNSRVYESCCKRLVRRVMEGYHGTVFAYGMTGTGKTFSMQGTSENPGVIPLAVTDIFSFIRETPHREFLLRVSYLEIYNEKIHDLLSLAPNSATGVFGQQVEEIKLREDSKRGVYATPLKEEIVQSPTQLLRVIARGDLARKTGSTQFNARSSRSHAVVQIVVESRERITGGGAPLDGRAAGGAIGGVRVSTLSLIDLAGSERAAETKERRQEGAHINKSLLTLGNVIARLSVAKDGKDKDHLPYRDSKLTRLLQPALAGSSLISILCTMASSTDANHTESLNTLKFAARAKNNIVSHAKKAEEALVTDAGSKVLLERYRHEIAELRGQLELQAKAQMESQEQEAQRHEEQMIEIQLARTALKERIDHLNRLILSSKSSGVNTTTGNGHNSTLLSARSSTYSTAPGPGPHAVPRTFSQSTFASIGPPPEFLPSDPGSDDSAGEYGDGSATLAAQVKALQADNADKSRYISTLERRLLQARRASQSRTSVGLATSPRISGTGDEGSLASIIREKDSEIANLRAQLDDKERMVAALRSSARKRELADLKVLKVRTKSIDDLLSSKRRASSNNPMPPPLKTGSDDITGNPVAEDEEELLLVKPLNISVRRTPVPPVRSSSQSAAARQTSAAKKKASVMSLPDTMLEPIAA